MRSSTHKHRDMARSILPSTQASARADANRARRSHRRSVRQDLHELTRELRAAPDAWLDHPLDPARTVDREINQLRRWRRDRDKLNHFIRWSVATTAALPPAERLSHLRATLPAGLIGDHAMSHLRRVAELQPVPDAWTLRLADRERAQVRARQRYLDRVARLRREVAELLVHGDHAAFNRALRPPPAEPSPDHPAIVRPLLGLHDVDSFVTQIGPKPRHGTSTAVLHVIEGAVRQVDGAHQVLDTS